ncbi:Acetyl-coenzyme A transporter 1 [Hondaea fermentalgiana]|uniref:Acetyl-coenzyme A transporter 1 n=1 Tax=Hondaea fermentalgiana TaxID=2315210 RepID=A0A2R5G9R8_9STRA|nr:Acetyl-coenzyme A transporter 1 [Hondaea fermentalgiana]|eukprot:GBG27796.1 Acetyl-coenzyme A transporter 1 [Hondaea fermentalgiana]
MRRGTPGQSQHGYDHIRDPVDQYEASARLGPSKSNAGTETDKRGLQGDYVNVAILLVLYTLQGVPLGLSQTMDLILQEKRLSFEQQGIFSSVSWPYSLKILWAPVVDTVFFRAFGRRKSWLVPTQILIGILLIWAPSQLDTLLGETDGAPKVMELTTLFFIFYLLAATQDVAVDGWAVTMLARRNIGYASTCNAVGQTFGFFLAFTGFMGLEMYGYCDLATFMRIWGWIFIASTLLIAVFKHERSEEERAAAERKEMMMMSAAEAGGELNVAHEAGDIPDSIGEAYAQMRTVLTLPGVRELLVILATRGVAFAAADSLAQRKLVERGMKKEHVASLTVIITPLNILLPGIISRETSGRPLSGLFKNAYLPRVFVGLFSMFLVIGAPDFAAHPDGLPWGFLLVLLCLLVVHSILSTAMFVAMMGFFAQVSDPAIGGTYMTLLNTIANLGSKWPNQFVLFIVDHLTIRSCTGKELPGETCPVWIDGFVPVSIGCVLLGCLWYMAFAERLDRLQNLDISMWRIAPRRV